MDTKRAASRKKFPSLYKHSFQEAGERGELDQFYAARRLNTDCARAINTALQNHYSYKTYCLDTAAASKEVVDKFGFERTMYVLANTVQHFEWDGRLSRASKEWARTIPIFDDTNVSKSYLVSAHPGLTDMLVGQVRRDYLLTQPIKAADIRAEAERILKQLQTAPEPNSPSGTHFMAQISPDFLARAKSKDRERLMDLLPFSSLAFSTLKDREGIYALITADENRSQSLRLRKPSVKERLAVEPIPGDLSAKPKNRDAR